MNLNRRNYPPDHGIRVPFDELRRFVSQLLEAAGMPAAQAGLLADILVRNNRRCIYSHGTGQIPYYLDRIGEGAVNPRPEVTVVSEAAASLVLDGDGGLGYFPCHHGTERAIEKARVGGVAALTTRNHYHIGSAGIYTRMAVEQDCIGIATSAHRGYLKPDAPIAGVVSSSPLSIAVPAGEQPPVVMDMGGALIGYDEELFKRLPTALFKVMAMSAAIHSLGAVFSGAHRAELVPPVSAWESNQGSFIAVVDVAHFMPVDELKTEMDRYVESARQTRPLPGMDYAELAGGNEWRWEKENRVLGIPMGEGHVEALQVEADRLGVESPFAQYEETRF